MKVMRSDNRFTKLKREWFSWGFVFGVSVAFLLFAIGRAFSDGRLFD